MTEHVKGALQTRPPKPVSTLPIVKKAPDPMRMSRYFLPVLKENPAEAQIVSHRLMLRAGMIRQAQVRGSILGCRWVLKFLRKIREHCAR